MALPYVPLYLVFPRGKEAIALRVVLQKPRAWSYVAEMWCGVAQNAADGRIEGPAAVQQLEEWAGWDGAPGAFVEALCLPHIGLLDITERGFYVHNWDLHCGLHIQKREKDRERKRAARKEKELSVERPRKVRGQKKDVHPKSAHEPELEEEQEPKHTSQTDTDGLAGGDKGLALMLFRSQLAERLDLPKAVAVGKDPERVVAFFESQIAAVGEECVLNDCVQMAKKSTNGTPSTLSWFVGWLQRLPLQKPQVTA